MTTVINQKGRHPGKKLRQAEYKISARFPLEMGRDCARNYQDSTVVFEVSKQVMASGKGRLNCSSILILPFSGSDV